MKPLKAMLIFCLSLYLVSISSEISAKNINEIDETKYSFSNGNLEENVFFETSFQVELSEECINYVEDGIILFSTCGASNCDPGQCCHTYNEGADCACTTCGGSGDDDDGGIDWGGLVRSIIDTIIILLP